jgi:hypothetical protein
VNAPAVGSADLPGHVASAARQFAEVLFWALRPAMPTASSSPQAGFSGGRSGAEPLARPFWNRGSSYRGGRRYSMTMEGTTAATPGGKYRARPGRSACVIASLKDLHGPAAGTVTLPLRLYWSGPSPVFDLGDGWDLEWLYETVLVEAIDADELAAYLNEDLLIRQWPGLYLPKGVRRAWEERHPVLARRRAAAVAAA